MSVKIPEVRGQFLVVAQNIEAACHHIKAGCDLLMQSAQDIRKLEMELHRRTPIRVAPVQSRRMDPALKARIRELARDNPLATQQWISEQLGVTAGRVSETLRGKRH